MRRLLVVLLLVALCLVALPRDTAPVSAQSGNLWTAYFYSNQDWAGNPSLTQTLSFISYNWGYGSPGANIPTDYFTARFVTDAFFYAGTYTFTVTADDEIALRVDGVTYVDTRGAGQSGKTFTVSVPMTYQGNHHIEILYREYTLLAYVFVNWAYGSGGGIPPQPPQPPPTPPPSSCSPSSATSVQTKYGDYTPCIQQNIHQKNCYQSDGAWNSPNMGSIETEPQIQIWGNCVGDSVQAFQVSCDPEVPLKDYKCSKTEAGWFPN